MALFIPSFKSKKSPTPSSASGAQGANHGWQRSGARLQRTGERERGAATSIGNVGRELSRDGGNRRRGVSSISRVKEEKEIYAGGLRRRTTDPFTTEEQRQADERRYDYIRRLIKERKAKEQESGKQKKKGLFF